MKNDTGQSQGQRKNNEMCIDAENNSGAQMTDQDPDCWGELWQHIKTKSERLLGRKK